METATVVEFLSLLLLGGSAGLALGLSRPGLRRNITESGLQLVSLVAVGATFASLYLSEIADFIPCELCWFQRIAMYPMAIIMPVAAFRKDQGAIIYSAVLSAVGLAVALYHVQLQMFPEQSSFCELANPCTASWIKSFGWMTIPQMTAISFALILSISIATIRSNSVKQHRTQETS